MDNRVKALLLGVDLRYRDNGDGSSTRDSGREQRFAGALDRLVIETDQLRPDTLSEMIESGEEVVEWLATHPKARIKLGFWQVTITSPEFADVDWEWFDPPFTLDAAVEDFSKSKAGTDGWECSWALG